MTPPGFRARTGALTLIFLASAEERSTLLGILADAMVDEEDRQVALDELADPDEYDIEDLADEGLAETSGEAETKYVLAYPHQSGPEPGPGPDALMAATPEGVEVLFVASILEDWLRRAPAGPLALGEIAAGGALAALICAWGPGLAHRLARGPHSLPELDAALPEVPRRAIEEHLAGMENAELAETVTGADEETLYAATAWLREAIGPIAAAARLELRHPKSDVAPPEAIDVEAGFRLALPLLELAPDVSGSYRLAVELEGGDTTGVTARFAHGRLVECTADLEQDVDCWATASALDWLDTLVDPSVARIQSGGEARLSRALLQGLHERLFVVAIG